MVFILKQPLVYIISNPTGMPTADGNFSWWHHQMETFSGLLALCAGNSLVTSEFPSQRPVTRSFKVFFHLRLNKLWSKQFRHQWFEMPSHSLWCHCNDLCDFTSQWVINHLHPDYFFYPFVFKCSALKCWRFSSYSVRKSVTHLSYIVNTMAADDTVIYRARSSASISPKIFWPQYQIRQKDFSRVLNVMSQAVHSPGQILTCIGQHKLPSLMSKLLTKKNLEIRTGCRWLSARKMQLQCISNRITSFLTNSLIYRLTINCYDNKVFRLIIL